MSKLAVYGYPERLSAKAGETLNVMLSAEGAARVRTSLVRLIHGDEHPDGPGFLEEPVADVGSFELAAVTQPVQRGNFLRVEDAANRLGRPGPFALFAFIQPTLLGGEQTVMGRLDARSQAGFGLRINAEGYLQFWTRTGGRTQSLTASVRLVEQTWYLVSASFDPAAASAELHQVAVINRYNGRLSRIVPYDYDCSVSGPMLAPGAPAEQGTFIIGGLPGPGGSRPELVGQCYDGKIDRAGVTAEVLSRRDLGGILAGETPADLVALWDPTIGYTDRGIGDHVADIGPHGLHAHGVNRPVRAQTGWNWSGRNDCFRLAPGEYGGIEYHHDALTDCCWEPSVSLALPHDLRSGAYALKVTAENAADRVEDYVVFFVRAAKPRAPICLLLPTASYLAYANCRSHTEADVSQAVLARVPVFQQSDIDGIENDLRFGLSTYDHHADGAGVCYASARRPIFTMHPKYRVPGVDCAWQFPADLSVLAWLEHFGYDYEILTDEDLDREGVSALLPYRVVINGTHCEYYSEKMLDATEDYLLQGGRLTYLSGNGYYWVVAFREDEPGIMEVRKLDAGSRAWQARPGEGYLATTGERGGIWRLRGRPPQKLVGTGFASEGMDRSFAFHRMPDSYDTDLAWMFEGIDAPLIGDFGLAHGGAVGLEIDRFDRSLGSPPHARLLASSGTLTQNWQLVAEDVMFMYPGMGGDEHPEVRCDMVYFTTPNGGAVFSPSSIAWGSALPFSGFENNVSRLMRNVLDRFLLEEPLPE